MGDELDWYSVRCVFAWAEWEGRPFEERITLWRAGSLDEAIELAEREAQQYAAENAVEFLRLSQAYALDPHADLGSGTEVFSLLRDSDLPSQTYVETFFATGQEHAQGDDGKPGLRALVRHPRRSRLKSMDGP